MLIKKSSSRVLQGRVVIEICDFGRLSGPNSNISFRGRIRGGTQNECIVLHEIGRYVKLII